MDVAANAKVLLDAVTCAGHVATGILEIKEQCGNDGNTTLRKKDVANLGLFADTLQCIEEVGRQKVQDVCRVSHVLSGYDKLMRDERKKDVEVAAKTKTPYFIRKVKAFRKSCSNGLFKKSTVSTPPKDLPPANEPTRRSVRETTTVTPEKSTKEVLKDFNGHPPYPYLEWTNESLIRSVLALDKLNGSTEDGKNIISRRKFMQNVVAVGKSSYKDQSGIHRMVANYFKDGKIPEGRGRPSTIGVSEMESMVKSKIADHDSDSSRFKIEHMKEIYTTKKREKAEEHGLESERVSCPTDAKTLKTAMMATAMNSAESGIGISEKKMAKKTEARYKAEHSVMKAYSYAATVLATHFIEGPQPFYPKTFQRRKLSVDAKTTIDN